jgi:hypothetical protein
MLLRKEDPYALAAKLLLAFSKCERNKHDRRLCANFRRLGCLARELAFRCEVLVTEEGVSPGRSRSVPCRRLPRLQHRSPSRGARRSRRSTRRIPTWTSEMHGHQKMSDDRAGDFVTMDFRHSVHRRDMPPGVPAGHHAFEFRAARGGSRSRRRRPLDHAAGWIAIPPRGGSVLGRR